MSSASYQNLNINEILRRKDAALEAQERAAAASSQPAQQITATMPGSGSVSTRPAAPGVVDNIASPARIMHASDVVRGVLGISAENNNFEKK